MNTRSSLIVVTSLTATFVAMCAAVFSVTGIAKLFAGAAFSAGVMAASLELGKIVSISVLYQYWEKIPRALKLYLNIAAMVLMLITSAGIYGYLSSAYAKVAATPLQMYAEVQTINNRASSVDQDIERKNQRLNQLIALRIQQETRLDQLVLKSTTGNGTTIRTAQTALNNADKDVKTLQKEISNLSNQRDSLKGASIGKQVEIDTNADIGTFVYIAKMFNTNLDTVVKWFILIIVLVFDPLAVALVIAVNFLLKQNNEASTKLPEIITTQKQFDKTQELVDSPPEPTESLKTLMADPEPVTPQPAVETPLQPPPSEQNGIEKYLDLNENGIPDWMEADYNWDDTQAWINNPIARMYKQRVIDKH